MLKGDSILGIGYTSPYLEPYLEEEGLAAVCMPAQQGAAYWPAGEANRVFLAHESSLPLAENSINRVLMVHSVENSEQLSWMMSEAWRVLTPGGRILIAVPNRLGVWSHVNNNPFGSGRPFSMSQLKELLADHDFMILRRTHALFILPVNSLSLCRLAHWFERVGAWLYPLLSGVLLVEAEKQVYASIRQPVTQKGMHMPVRAQRPAMGLKKNG
jgi:SAM-dependent methyltransferase